MDTERLLEITDQTGLLIGQQTTLDEANNHGHWHRTAHVVIYTPTKQLLIQKRSSSIIRHPGLLDISVGGAVLVGETPEQAIVRRTYEEIGIRIETTDLKPIGLTKYNHRLPKYNKHVRAILCTFMVRLPSANVPLHYLRNEVSWAGFISLSQAKKLVSDGQLDRIGKTAEGLHRIPR